MSHLMALYVPSVRALAMPYTFLYAGRSECACRGCGHGPLQSTLHPNATWVVGLCRRRVSSWLLPTYTRKDCRCGHCSLGDEDPCPYAK